MLMSTACQSVTSTGTAPRGSPQERKGRAVLLSRWLRRGSGTMRCVVVLKSTSVNMSFPERDTVIVGILSIRCVGHY